MPDPTDNGPDPIREATFAERREQVAMFAALTPQQWEAPSLCAGWRVHEVLAHTTMAFRYSLGRVVLELVKARGSFDRLADRRARADAAALTPEQLVANLRENVEHPWTPPGGGPLGALSHDLIHGLDVSVALGLDRRPPPERAALVLTGLSPKQLAFFGVDLDGVRLQATDTGFTYGEGERLAGRTQDLLLLACGRKLPAGVLEGAQAGRYTG